MRNNPGNSANTDEGITTMKTFAEAVIEARTALVEQLMQETGESDPINAVGDLDAIAINDSYTDVDIFINPNNFQMFAGEGDNETITLCDNEEDAQRLVLLPDSQLIEEMARLVGVDQYLEDHLVDALECHHQLIARLINEDEQEIWGEFDGEVLTISNAREDEEFKLISDDWAELEDIVGMQPRLFAVKFADRLRAPRKPNMQGINDMADVGLIEEAAELVNAAEHPMNNKLAGEFAYFQSEHNDENDLAMHLEKLAEKGGRFDMVEAMKEALRLSK